MAKNHLPNGLQTFMGEVYEAACYALCLIDVAYEFNSIHQPAKNTNFNVLDILLEACSGTTPSSIIYYNSANIYDPNNFYVQHPDYLLQLCTGKMWNVEKSTNLAFEPKLREYRINYFERETTGRTVGHFDRDFFHPYLNSLTVKNGKLKSIRICRVIA